MSEKLSRIQTAVEIREVQLVELGGCRDGNCIVLRTKGQHTNGGCRCSRDYIRMERLARIERRFAECVLAVLTEDNGAKQVNFSKFVDGLNILKQYYDNLNGFHMGSEHDTFYTYRTDRPLTESDVEAMKALGWFQPEPKGEDYDPEEGWAAYT
jgi:hypothetical protein